MPVLNQNQNQNQNQSIAEGVERRFRARYNSDIYARLFNTGGVLVPAPTNPGGAVNSPPRNYPAFHARWDAELQACTYLRDFELRFAANPGAVPAVLSWFDRYRTLPAVLNNVPGGNMTRPEMTQQVLRILDLSLEREDRFSEIIDQDDADGALNYWQGMLKIHPARHPHTYLLLRVARRVGEHVVMCLKDFFAAPRPSQLCPAIEPMIDPPVTPSYPAGHALQAHLASYLLAYCLPNLPGQPNLPAVNTLAYPGTQGSGPLFDLAWRVSENRIVAGIHYPIDIEAGIAVAIECFKDLHLLNSVTTLMGNVSGEFPQYQ
jgi:membrane-associated phospholipid phosphatase